LTLEDVEVIFDKSLSNGDACGWLGPLGVKTLDLFGLDNSNAWCRHLLGGNIAEPRFISLMLCFHRPTCLDPILMIFGPDKRSSRRPPILYTWHTCFQSWYSVFAGRLARHSMAQSKRRVILSSYSLVDPSQHRPMVLQGDVVTPLIDCLGVSWRVRQLLFFLILSFESTL
jgi:hypothetical protein